MPICGCIGVHNPCHKIQLVSSLRNYWLEGLTMDSCGSNRGETHYGREVGIFVLVRHIHLKSTLSEIVICILSLTIILRMRRVKIIKRG